MSGSAVGWRALHASPHPPVRGSHRSGTRALPLTVPGVINTANQPPIRELQGLFDRLGHTRPLAGAGNQAIDHHLDVVLMMLAERRSLTDAHCLTIDARPQVTAF